MPTVNPSPLLPRGPSGATLPDLELRIHVRWSASELDAALAAGADPASSAELALRAEQLTAAEKREQLVRRISNLIRFVDQGTGVQLSTARVPINRERVRRHRGALAEISGRITSAGLPSVRGLASINLLFDESGSPLYDHELSEDRLGPVLEEALVALERSAG